MINTRILISGGCGFLGSNLALHGLKQGYPVCVIDNLSRVGSNNNLEKLRSAGELEFVKGDVQDKGLIDRCGAQFKPDAVFHLAGQVAMTTSIADPYDDFLTNSLGTLNMLEAIRKHVPHAHIIYSSTNKVYGDLDHVHYDETESRYVAPDFPLGFDESTPLEFHSPYGCSKGAADQYMLDYCRTFNLNTTVFRHSSMYGGMQYPTYDQGWIGWFCQQSLLHNEGNLDNTTTISGNGKQVRDVLHVDDLVTLYYQTVARTEAAKGQVFNIGGGADNSLSILELIILLSEISGYSLPYQCIEPRSSDQKIFIADITKAKRLLDWEPKVSARQGIEKTFGWASTL